MKPSGTEPSGTEPSGGKPLGTKPLGIRFPTPAEAALQNAAECRGLTVGERLNRLLAFIRAVEEIANESPIRARQLAEHDLEKDEELRALIQAQVRGHA